MKYVWFYLLLAVAASDSVAATDDHNWWIARLKKVASLRSGKQRPPYDITVALAASLDRFEALELLCQHSWPGTITAAVYIPLWQARVHLPNVSTSYHGLGLPEALVQLEGMYDHLQTPEGACALDMDVYAEDVPELSDWFTFPVNSMRNRALAMVNTEVVLLLDADFIIGPSHWAHALTHNQTVYNMLSTLLQRKAALVLPALRDIDNPEYVSTTDSKAFVADAIRRDSKEYIVQQLRAQKLFPFMMPHHADTDYDRWCNATQPYYVPYAFKGRQPDGSPAYEPYILTRTHGLPSYDERFRGFFKNKISFLWYLHVLGYQFHVDPEGFVIHYPHTKQNIPQQMHSAKHHELMRIWSEEMPAAMADGTYKPIVGGGMTGMKHSRARRKLPLEE